MGSGARALGRVAEVRCLMVVPVDGEGRAGEARRASLGLAAVVEDHRGDQGDAVRPSGPFDVCRGTTDMDDLLAGQ
ncbi:hypothetical protein IQ64_04480 [Streptomyces stelliscabiei]|nr:hypothetical protein IQ64_04480 [Streptomyces stelliscabiei]